MSEWFYKQISWLAGILAILVLFGLIIFSANIEIKDMDLWLHLAAGRHILQDFSIPKADIFSCTIAGTPWLNHEWLFQALVVSVYEALGIEGLIDLKAAVVFLTFVLLLLIGYVRDRQLGPTLILFLVLLVYQHRLTLRPDIFSLLFFVLYICILGSDLDKRWSLGIAALIQIVWVNMHGFFIFGPILVAVSLISEWLKRHARLPYEWNTVGRLSDEEYKRLKVMLLLVVLACLVNPYFIKGAWYPVGVFFSLGGESQVFFERIQELQRPLSWSTLWGWYPYMPYRVLILISLGMFAFNRRKIDVTALLLWTLFFVFSLMALRNMVFFALAAYLSFLANGQYLDDEEFLPPRWRGKRVRAVFSTALKVGLIIWIIGHGRDLMLRGYYDFDKFERKSEFGGLSQRNFPHQAADFLVDNKVRGNFFNDFNSGAYLIGRTFPEVKVYIDGRTEVYGADFFKEHREIWQGDAALFDEAADRYRLTGAFLNSVYVPAPEKLIRHLYTSKAWILVYFDYDAAVFLRDLPGNRDMINRYAIDLSQWQVPEAPLLKIGTHKVIPYRYVNRAYALYNMGFPGKAEGEAVEALRIEPYNAKAHKLLGKIYNERGAYARAFESLRKAKLLLPRDSKVRYQIALALFHMGEIKQAEEQCQRVLSLKPEDEEALVLMNRIRAAGESNKEMEAVPAL